MLFGVLGWALLGLFIGFAASRLIDLRGDDPRLGIAVGGLAGLIGGWGYSLFGDQPNWLNGWSLLWAGIAACLAVLVWHLIRRRSPYERQSIRRSY